MANVFDGLTGVCDGSEGRGGLGRVREIEGGSISSTVRVMSGVAWACLLPLRMSRSLSERASPEVIGSNIVGSSSGDVLWVLDKTKGECGELDIDWEKKGTLG